jgi:hypothetical protein
MTTIPRRLEGETVLLILPQSFILQSWSMVLQKIIFKWRVKSFCKTGIFAAERKYFFQSHFCYLKGMALVSDSTNETTAVITNSLLL